MDLLPTIAEITNTIIPTNITLDGDSLTHLWLNKDGKVRLYIYILGWSEI